MRPFKPVAALLISAAFGFVALASCTGPFPGVQPAIVADCTQHANGCECFAVYEDAESPVSGSACAWGEEYCCAKDGWPESGSCYCEVYACVLDSNGTCGCSFGASPAEDEVIVPQCPQTAETVCCEDDSGHACRCSEGGDCGGGETRVDACEPKGSCPSGGTPVAGCDGESEGPDLGDLRPHCTGDENSCSCLLAYDGNDFGCTLGAGSCCAETGWPDSGSCSCAPFVCTYDNDDFCFCSADNKAEVGTHVVPSCPNTDHCCLAESGETCICRDTFCSIGEISVDFCPTPCPQGGTPLDACN